MLEVKGEIAFKTIAYHRAADAIARSPIDLVAAYRAGKPPKVPGVGSGDQRQDHRATSRPAGWLTTRTSARRSRPASSGCSRSPASGPRPSGWSTRSSAIETIEDLRHAAEAGTLRGLKGLSERTEQQILAGIEALESRPAKRLLLPRAEQAIDSVIEGLSGTPGLRGIETAGSFRRKRETIGDLDLLAETDDPKALMERFVGLGLVDEVVGRGGHKSAIRIFRGPQVDLMSMPPGEAGAYLIHFTGSKEHNVRLRAIARDKGWSLSEYGFQRIGEDGEPLTGDAAERRTFATEAEAYAFLDLPFIEPELREDAGEIEAARAGRLPTLVTQADLRGDCHTHSEWSDGNFSIEDDGRGLPAARLRLPGADRPLPSRSRSPAASRRTGSSSSGRSSPRSTPGSSARSRTGPPRRRRRRRASGSSTAASSRSAPMGRSTTTTSCSPASTSSSRRSTSPAASRRPS